MLCLWVLSLKYSYLNEFSITFELHSDQGTCRSVITANETYFVSPQYPALHSERLDPPYCIFTLQRNSLIIKWPVCQIRLDFDEFSLAPPVTGNCGNGQTDSFIVSGATNFNQSGLPEGGLCGELTGQHSNIKSIVTLILRSIIIFTIN